MGGFGAERLAIATNGCKGVYEVEPYGDLEALLIKQSGAGDADRARVRRVAAYVPAILWLVNDGASGAHGASKPKQVAYRNMLKEVAENVAGLQLDHDEIYLELFKTAADFYAKDDDYKSVAGLEATCLEEIKRQKKRSKK